MLETLKTLGVTVPQTPHSYLSPNSGKHRRTREPYAQSLKTAAALATRENLRGTSWQSQRLLRVELRIYWERGHKRLDYDNAIASCKALLDGVFQEIGADDRQVMEIKLVQGRTEGQGYTNVQIIELPDAGDMETA